MAEPLATALPWIALALALALLVQTVRLAWLRALPGRRLRGRAKRAARGELEAEALLRDLGFEIIGRQVPHAWSVHVDGLAHAVDLRVDLLVEKAGRRFVAEVKTGKVAPVIENPATRRQLLEYHHAAGAEGVLLVDADLGTVREVSFPALAGAPSGLSRLAWLGLGAATGAAVAWFLHP